MREKIGPFDGEAGVIGFDARRLRVLVIEDNQHVRRLLRTVLHTLGVTAIQEARDGEEALAMLRTAPADLLIVDWKMKPMDGLSFALKLRRSGDSPAPTVPIIMVTSLGEESLLRDARDAGVDDFITKPLSARALISRMAEVLTRPRPIVRGGGYVGPCRRRRGGDYGGPERRAARELPQTARVALPNDGECR